MGNDRLQRLGIHRRANDAKPGRRCDFLHPRLPQGFQDADVEPADVELVPFVGKLG